MLIRAAADTPLKNSPRGWIKYPIVGIFHQQSLRTESAGDGIGEVPDGAPSTTSLFKTFETVSEKLQKPRNRKAEVHENGADQSGKSFNAIFFVADDGRDCHHYHNQDEAEVRHISGDCPADTDQRVRFIQNFWRSNPSRYSRARRQA